MRALAVAVVLAVSVPAAAQDEQAPEDIPGDLWETRVPPVMPPWAERSGYCCMTPELGGDGDPVGMTIGHCSEEVFRPSTELALTKWKLSEDAGAYFRETPGAHGQLMRFYLTDENGLCLPTIEGEFCDARGGFRDDITYADLCRADWVS